MTETSDTKDESARIDVWAWAVRLYKTRSLAATACKREQLLVNGLRCKPSRQIRPGDRVEAKRGPLTLTVEVKAVLSKRVGAKRVEEFAIDRTPPEVYAAAEEARQLARNTMPQREAGAGRPTKRERRELDQLMEDAAEEQADFEEFVKSFTKRK